MKISKCWLEASAASAMGVVGVWRFELPVGARPLSVLARVKDGSGEAFEAIERMRMLMGGSASASTPCVYLLVDEALPMAVHTITALPESAELDRMPGAFVATLDVNGKCWHIFHREGE